MSTELLLRSVEDASVENKRKIGLAIIEAIGISLSDIPENLGSKPGLNETDWKFRGDQLLIQNYLENNDLNTANEDSSAENILSKHGITRDNFKDFFNDSVTASNLIAAYEVTHPHSSKKMMVKSSTIIVTQRRIPLS